MRLASRRALLLGALTLACTPGLAEAQVARPRLRERTPSAPDRLRAQAYRLRAGARLQDWRDRLELRRRRARRQLGRDQQGRRFARNVILAAAPSEASLAQAEQLGFRVGRRVALPNLGIEVVALRPPLGADTADSLAALQAADPDGAYALNHLFDPGAEGEFGAAAAPPPLGPPAPGVRIGMIDAGLTGDHPVFEGVRLRSRGFTDSGEAAIDSPHGAAVGSVLATALPKAEILAADVFGEDDLAGSAESIVRALAWLAGEGVAVINISLCGPENAVVGAVLKGLARRGVLVVAPCGNDGPTSPVAFPASHPDTLAVTAVDTNRRAYLAANRGPEIAFAAEGVDVPVAEGAATWATASGTSFAAPVVAAHSARRLTRPDPQARERLLAALAGAAEDLGQPGRDPVYGFGYLPRLEGPLLVRN